MISHFYFSCAVLGGGELLSARRARSGGAAVRAMQHAKLTPAMWHTRAHAHTHMHSAYLSNERISLIRRVGPRRCPASQ